MVCTSQYSNSFAAKEMDIEVVLTRASELHAKINDAIERAMKSEFLQSTAGVKRSSNSNMGGVVEAESGLLSSSPGFDGNEFDNDSYERGGGEGGAAVAAGKGDSNAEARSLGSIRDALEVLEEQLKALQAVQQKQRAEKDMALAELEESRGILLGLLKKHRGHEWEVVCEALAFAGEPVDEREDLPLPPYPMSTVNPPTSSSSMAGGGGGSSIDAAEQSPQFRSFPVSHQKSISGSGAVKRLTLFGGRRLNDGDDDIQFLGGDKVEENNNRHEEGTSHHGHEEEEEEEMDGTKNGSGFLQLPINLFRFSGAVFGHAKNIALVVMSVLAFLAISEMGEIREQKKLLAAHSVKKPDTSPPSPPPLPLAPKPAVSFLQCPTGKKLIMEDGHAKCVVKERIELPFVREVKTPDVLYGRG